MTGIAGYGAYEAHQARQLATSANDVAREAIELTREIERRSQEEIVLVRIGGPGGGDEDYETFFDL